MYLPKRLLRSLTLPSLLCRLQTQPLRVAGACCGVRWAPTRRRAEGAAGTVAAQHGQNWKICLASPGTGWPQQLCQPHLVADPSGAHAGEKPAGTPCQTRKQNLPSCLQEASRHRCPGKNPSPRYPCGCWAGPGGYRDLAQGDRHLQVNGCMAASTPSVRGAQLVVGPQGTQWCNTPWKCLGNACSSGDEGGCSAPAWQGGQTGRGDTAWAAPSPSTNRNSSRHTARSDFTGNPVVLN